MDFDSSLKKVLEFEGGYVNDAQDPGGETNLGISKRAYPNLDIKSLTPETVAPIYKANYWNQIGADALSSPLNFLAFDCAVNQGPNFAKSLLALTRDITRFTNMRMQHYRMNANWSKYGQGWTDRVIHGLTYALGGV